MGRLLTENNINVHKIQMINLKGPGNLKIQEE